jgi:hypothetical protein
MWILLFELFPKEPEVREEKPNDGLKKNTAYHLINRWGRIIRESAGC